MVFLVDSIQNGNRTELLVYSRDSNNNKKLEVVSDFYNYFFVLEEETVPTDTRIHGVQKGFVSINGEKVKKIMVYNTHDIKKLKTMFSKHFEADIPIEQRYIIDVLGETPLCNLRTLYFDIETNSHHEFPNMEKPDQEITSISITDSYTGKSKLLIYKPLEHEHQIENDDVVKVFDTEEKLLYGFIHYIKTFDPDILSGWNVLNFDFPYLIKRMKGLGVDYTGMSPHNNVYLNEKYDDVKITGRIVLDMMPGYKYFRSISNQGKAENYSLDFTANEVLGVGKITHTETFHELWKYSPEKLVEYNIRDTELVHKINEKLKIISFFDSIRAKSCSNLESIFHTSVLVDGLLLNVTRGNPVLPSKHEDGGDKYDGAFVFEPTPGVYDFVLALDIKCISDDTEILTNNGWKNIDNISYLDKALTFNTEKDLLEYQNIKHITKNNYIGEMINIKTNKTDQLLTPNHRVLHKKGTASHGYYNSKKYEYKRADESFSMYDRILTSGKYYNGKTKMSDDMVRLCGWIISEGYFHNHNGISIYQSETHNPEYCNEIYEILNNLKISYSVKKSQKNNITWYIKSKSAKSIKEILYHNKRITRELLDLPFNQLHILYNTLMRGDGHISKNNKSSYCTRDKEDAELFAELCTKIDKRANIKEITDNRNNKTKKYYVISIGSRQKYSKIKKEHVQYNGRVWCISTDNTNFIAKRNGKTFITGNSMYPNIIKTFNMGYETFNKDGAIKITDGIAFDDKEGFIPGVLTMLAKERAIYKKKVKEATNDNDKQVYHFRQYAVKVLANCFSYDTDILTPEGQRNIKDLKVGDIVYSINPETKDLELKPVTRTYEYDYDGDMYHFNTQSMDLLVTPNHRMLQETKLDTRHFVEAEDYNTQHSIPLHNSIGKYDTLMLFEKGSYDKHIPEVVINKIHNSIMFNSLYKGDGYKKLNKYTTVSEKLKDQLIILLTELGYKVRWKKDDSGCYRIIMSNEGWRPHTSNITVVKNNSNKIYCVEVADNHTVLAGRNNKFTWTGQSIYGYLGFPKARLYKKEVAFAVTHMGQRMIKKTAEVVEKLGYKVVYGDTDSVYVKAKNNNLLLSIKEGYDLVKLINEAYKEFAKEHGSKNCFLEMEFEKAFKNILFAAKRGDKDNKGAKKRYAYTLFWKDGEYIDSSMQVSGFDLIRCLAGSTEIIIKQDNHIRKTKISDLKKTNISTVEILDEYGNFIPVKNIFISKNTELLRMRLKNGSEINATKNHKFLVKREEEELLLQFDEIKDTDKIPISNTSVDLYPEIGTYEFGRFIGLYLAEGNKTDHYVRFSFGSHELEYIKFIKEYVENTFAKQVTISVNGTETIVHIHSSGISSLISDFVCGNNCYTKHLSSRAYRTSHNFKRGIIDGVIQGDGDVTDTLTSASKKLINDVAILMSLVGQNYTRYKPIKSKKIINTINGMECLSKATIYRIKRQKNKTTSNTFNKYYKHTLNGITWMDIDYIEKNTDTRNDFNVYDIEVDSNSHLFRLANGIITHNSDTPRLAKTVQENVLRMALDKEDESVVVDYIKDLDKKIRSGVIPPEEIGFPKGITENLKDYKSEGPVIQGAKYSNKYLGTRFGKGSKPKFVYIKNVPNGYPDTPVLTFEDEIPDGFIIDYDKMNERIFEMKLRSIFNAAGWTWKDINSNQSSMEGWL